MLCWLHCISEWFVEYDQSLAVFFHVRQHPWELHARLFQITCLFISTYLLGRTSEWPSEGQEFEPPWLHHLLRNGAGHKHPHGLPLTTRQSALKSITAIDSGFLFSEIQRPDFIKEA
jgi:hypothetical protein